MLFIKKVLGITKNQDKAPIVVSPCRSTVCEKNVWITSDIVGLRSAIRKFGVDRFKSNCVRASDGLLWAIRLVLPFFLFQLSVQFDLKSCADQYDLKLFEVWITIDFLS